MTLIEYDAAFRGYLESRGIDPDARLASRADLDDLMRRYPDAPSTEG